MTVPTFRVVGAGQGYGDGFRIGTCQLDFFHDCTHM